MVSTELSIISVYIKEVKLEFSMKLLQVIIQKLLLSVFRILIISPMLIKIAKITNQVMSHHKTQKLTKAVLSLSRKISETEVQSSANNKYKQISHYLVLNNSLNNNSIKKYVINSFSSCNESIQKYISH
jgi:hypothetical protein